MWRDYLILAKPGIIMGNLISCAAGYFLAARGHIEPSIIAAIIGTSLVVASGCVFNNYIDRDIDQKMRRTQYREEIIQRTGIPALLIYATALGILGFLVLGFFTNLMALSFSLLGFIVYVGLYSLRYKRHSTYGTLIGSLSGACPPIIGYVAVTNHFDVGALILLATFCFWQIPHSYAIAIYRFKDYQAAKIPVLPISDGVSKARRHMIAYIIAFAIASLMLSLCGYVGGVYTLVMGLISLYWLYLAKVGYKPDAEQLWAKKVFLFSIVVIMAFSMLISIDFVLPGTSIIPTI